MDNTSWEKIPEIKPEQRLTSEKRIEYLKNNLIVLQKSRERQIARDKILDALTETIAKINRDINRNSEAAS